MCFPSSKRNIAYLTPMDNYALFISCHPPYIVQIHKLLSSRFQISETAVLGHIFRKENEKCAEDSQGNQILEKSVGVCMDLVSYTLKAIFKRFWSYQQRECLPPKDALPDGSSS